MPNSTTGPIIDKAIGAMLGAAYGDALGWPNERRSRAIAKRYGTNGSIQQLKSWTRRSGGRFLPFEEIIEAGEYSDDTQLILCLSRSLLHGEKWWENWTRIELPFWTLYERGGGGATKRAADAWIDGQAPWMKNRNSKAVKSYFEAGGNGVAMRVLPHVLYHWASDSFQPIAISIFHDGIVTHGHPRALVGALAYGYALWKSIRRDSRLEYGKIAEELLSGIGDWSVIPSTTDSIIDDWMISVHEYVSTYQSDWNNVVKEMENSLLICKNALSQGALTFEDDVLRQLQCFDDKVSGSGTVASAASVFLASRYAPDPINGVVKGAFAIGSDTDTIASMTGGLLGIICGSEWLSSHKSRVQDAKYICQIAQALLGRQMQIHTQLGNVGPKKHLQKWHDSLFNKPNDSTIILPDQRTANISFKPDQFGQGDKYKVELRKLICDDGQTIHIKRITKKSFTHHMEPPSLFASPTPNNHLYLKSNGRNFGPKIIVKSFDKSISFYRDFLGLSIKKLSNDVAVFDQGLVLVPTSYYSNLPENLSLCTLIYIQTTNIKERFSVMEKSGIRIVSKLASWGKTGMLFFRCLDPDGNVIEIYATEKEN